MSQSSSAMKKVLTRVVIPVGIMLFGLMCAGILIVVAPRADRTAPAPRVAVVDAVSVAPRDAVARVEASGAVVPAQQVQFAPDVAGRIVWISDDLMPGGQFEKGDVMARIDARDYRIAVQDAEARLRQAELSLRIERGRQDVARKEWEILGDGRPESEAGLALRKPHLQVQKEQVKAAEGGLQRARLNRGRTALVAPFNGIVVAENIDVGQYVGPGAPVITLVGTDELWVQLSLPVEKLTAIDIPGFGADGEGSPATIEQTLGNGERVVRTGRVVRLVGQLNPQTRTAELLISIRDPLRSEGGLPLLPGAYVDVVIDGKVLKNTYEVPRLSLLGGDRVWVAASDGTLKARKVQVGWRQDKTVVLTGGLEEGDQVVVSPLSNPVEGMPVRVRKKDVPVGADDSSGTPVETL